MMRIFLTLALIFAAGLAAAQERANTILVLDGSGSMWGQIDGVNKIVIAREVVGTLLDDFPGDRNLGLTVYGHRTRGDCTDIETVVDPGPGTLPAIRTAVEGINPRGRTPMTDAIIRAAEDLRYTENAATVILVSDGIETCNPDPCAAAAALEEAGIDFTAHVVGFDVTDPAALAQMQCIADGTGGQFLTAANAAELSQALTTVAAPPAPSPVDVQLVGRAGQSGAALQDVTWTVTQPAATGGRSTEATGAPLVALMPGTYLVSATWAQTGERVAVDAMVTDAAGQVVEVVFALPPVTVGFEARIGTADGPLIEDPVFWTLQSQDGEFGPANPASADLVQGSYVVEGYWTAQEATESVQFVVQRDPRTVVVVFPEPPVTASVTGPESAVAGSVIEVAWNGPAGAQDFIGIGRVDATGAGQWETFTYIEEGSPLRVQVPPRPGSYLISYFLRADGVVIGSAPLEVTPVSVSLTAPEEAVLGSSIEVAWTGPDYEGDYIGIGRVDATGAGLWETFAYTEAGSPARLLVPSEPGVYQITYFMAQQRTPVQSVALRVTEAQVSVTAPDTAVAGSEIEVAWDGPNAEGDYIGIGRVDATGAARWETFTYTEDGSPLRIRVPATPGAYQVTYFLRQDRRALVSAPLEVTELTATLTAPDEATVGDTIEVAWTGPDYDGDYVGIGRPDATGAGQWETFAYTEDGSPLTLTVPTSAGDYRITYFMRQDRTPLVSVPLTVSEAQTSLTAPASAEQGSVIEVAWTGPDAGGDYIGIGRIGATGSAQWETYASTADGNPLTVRVPPRAGDYEISYFLGQGRTKLASVPFEVTAVEVSVTAPQSAPAGSTVEIGWTGPDYDDDYIGIGRVGATGSGQWETSAYTRDGAPARFAVPPTPGDYEVTYFMDQNRTPLATAPLQVTALDVTITAPASARAGETVEVAWTGPNYEGDYIGIGQRGATGSGQWRAYAYTEDGETLQITLPDDLPAGAYDVTYFLAQGRTPVRRVPLEVAQ